MVRNKAEVGIKKKKGLRLTVWNMVTLILEQILYASIKGSMTDKGALARVMVNRAEVDMDEIQREFKRQHGIELRDALCDSDKIPSGDYRDFLVALTASK